MQQSETIVGRSVRYLTVLVVVTLMIAVTVSGGAGFAGTAAMGLDTTTLDLDRDGADFVPEGRARFAGGVDMTTLYLDRDGSDIAEGNWWGRSDYASAADDTTPGAYQGPDVTTLTLDHIGADMVSN